MLGAIEMQLLLLLLLLLFLLLSSKTSILTWCIPTYTQNNKPVKIQSHLVLEIAR